MTCIFSTASPDVLLQVSDRLRSESAVITEARRSRIIACPPQRSPASYRSARARSNSANRSARAEPPSAHAREHSSRPPS